MTRLQIVLIGMFLLLAGGMVATAHTSTSVARTETVAVPLGDAREATVNLSLDAGRIGLRALPIAGDQALAGHIEVGGRQRLHGTVDAGRDLRIDYAATRRFGIDLGTRGPRWELGVSADLPTALNVRAGTTDGRFDLRGTRVTSFRLDSDVGRQVVHLPRSARDATVTTGVGRIAVFLPAGAPATVHVDRGVRLANASDAFARTPDGFELAGTGEPLVVRLRAEMGTVSLRTY